ncbi:MAG: Phosphate regulon transcriptional regulatory protein PhoB [Deltaproteobacteria bacterium ADurb.Bin510]|nr:MAG: Phosphate regulon transcriptional regulatory protein PhoB [Deltaproteobacteria bacterium ADurb.Bin510]
MKTYIAVVDDEPDILKLVTVNLDKAGYQTRGFTSAGKFLDSLDHERPELVVLDLMLPDQDGFEVCRLLRSNQAWSDIPVIMLTARTQEYDKVRGLEIGADDYITKPFSPRELVARLKAVLRRTAPSDGEAPIEVGGLLLDPISHRVTIDGKPAEMGPTEYRLLQFFMTHQERAYTRSQLLDQVWGGNVYVEERTIDVHIRRLRKALEEFGYDRLIQTVRGAGYRFSTRLD